MKNKKNGRFINARRVAAEYSNPTIVILFSGGVVVAITRISL